MDPEPTATPFDPAATTRPIPALLRYYLIVSLLTLVAFPLVFLPHLFKYHSLRYKFDAEGVSMSWGVLFKREIYLTYRRIQDIHVSRNFIQRWLKLATVSVQTASGTSGAEMSIEGIADPEELRDYLYSQMRGSRDECDRDTSQSGSEKDTEAKESAGDEALELLTEILAHVRALRAERSDQQKNRTGVHDDPT